MQSLGPGADATVEGHRGILSLPVITANVRPAMAERAA